MFIRFNTQTGKLGVYATKKEAGTDMPVFGTQEELVASKATTAAIVAAYNMLNGTTLTKMADRQTAARRLFSSKLAEEPSIEEPTPEPQPEEPKAGKKGRGRKSAYVGQRLVALKHANPRRAGTHGFRSFEIVRGAGVNGISYEDYAAAGGRPNDLAWDIERGWVSAS